jgi:hypothetical protein
MALCHLYLVLFSCVVDCWNEPDECISEQLYMRQADAMVKLGFRDAGYTVCERLSQNSQEADIKCLRASLTIMLCDDFLFLLPCQYVNVDDCWADWNRTSAGALQGNATRFPSGMKALGDYLHARGLLFGIYGDIGTATCEGYPGSQGFLQQDADTFASWGVDSLKMDGCNSNIQLFAQNYPILSKALNSTNRPILYACSWPAYMSVAQHRAHSAGGRIAVLLIVPSLFSVSPYL